MNRCCNSKLKSLLGPVVVCGCLLWAGLNANAQVGPVRSPADPSIAQAIGQVSAEHIHENIKKLVTFGTRSTISAQDSDSVSAGRGIGAAREWIKGEFERYSKNCGGCLEVKTDTFTVQPKERIATPTELTNVYAVLKGTDAENAKRIVLVTGHYDSRNSDAMDATGEAPGANDDASGTAVSLECARVLSRLRFPATIIFLTVAGEEQGLYGSQHFAQMAKSQGWDIEGVLNNDIVGGNIDARQNPSVVRVFSEGVPLTADEAQLRRIRNLGGESDSTSRQLARYMAETAHSYRLPVRPQLEFRLDRFLRGGDHISFNEEGFAAVRLTEYREDFNRQHQNVRMENGTQYGDLPQFLNFDYVANVARLNAATLASLAAAPGPPANVHVLTEKLENDTTLTWDAPPGGITTGYEVLWRATSSPDWEHAKMAGNVTKITLPVSKDNVIFGVRTVGRHGHKSLPVTPVPQR